MLKPLVVIVNLAQLGFVLYLLADRGLPARHEVLLVLLILGAPIATLLYIFSGEGRADRQPSLFALFLERAKLEQRKKIKELEGDDSR
jgi:hypothetical protein